VRSFELDEHFLTLEGVVEFLCMMSWNKSILLPVDKADLLMGWQLLHMLADIHPRYLKTS
jgi:hypothetical protein